MSLKGLLEAIYPLHRTIVADDTDRALDLVGAALPPQAGWTTESYPPGSPAWTWTVPPRYVVHEAYLELVGGPRVVDFAEHPLHLVSYSEPVDAELDWAALEPHLHTAPHRPWAIPWEFSYYQPAWGFCLSQERFDALPRDGRYRAVIRSEFRSAPADGLRVGLARVDPAGGPSPDAPEMLLCAHIDHPAQANDDAAGVVTAVEVMRRLAEDPLPGGSMSVRLLLCPETIGSISYLSHNEGLIPRLAGGVFLEMTGSAGPLVLQRSLQDTHRLDRAANAALRRSGVPFSEAGFGKVRGNDERVINGPGVGVPCISLLRWPYPEYHTSDDDPTIITEEALVEAADVAEQVVRMFASDFIPRRRFRGPAFLSGHGLWVDWRTQPELNEAIDLLLVRMDGRGSVFEIAEELQLDYWLIRDYIEKLHGAGLIDRLPIPAEGLSE
jgi:aminopeptidase-like protein